MKSSASLKSANSVRRGPTLRGGRYRQLNRSINKAEKKNKEEKIESTSYISSESSDYDIEIGAEKAVLETIYMYTEKVETLEMEQPIYNHGDKTAGECIIDPKDSYKKRKEAYHSGLSHWPQHHNIESQSTIHLDGVDRSPHTSENIEYNIVLHFKQLRGNQAFVLDQATASDFCIRLSLNQKERIMFNGVHDTDGLTAFLYKIKREFSIKIHHKTELARANVNSHIESHHSDQNLNNNIIEFNDNVYIEFKPRNDYIGLHADVIKRPFFQYPEPDLSADIGEEKTPSWLELFYDLFYVATLTEFTHTHHIKDLDSLWLYTQWFTITWWGWCASSLYTARFDTDDIVHHIYKLIEMCALIGMAGSSEYFLNSAGYVYGYIALKAVLVCEYLVVFIVSIMAKSKSRSAFGFYVGANLLSIALWASSLTILEKSMHRILWYLGVFSEVLVNIIVRGDKTLSWAASHLAERLGLLSLIVLGENLMGLVTLVSTAGTNIIIVIPNFMAVVIIFGFFFMYFEDFNKEIFLHNKHHQIWVYLHFPLHLCQVAFGIALIDTLKIYRQQMIKESKLPDDEILGEKGLITTKGVGQIEPHLADQLNESTDKKPETPKDKQKKTEEDEEDPTTEFEDQKQPNEKENESEKEKENDAVKLAKRAILSVNNSDKDYNPMKLSRFQYRHSKTLLVASNSGYVELFSYLTSSATTMLIGLITHELSREAPSITEQTHLHRRAPEEDSEKEKPGAMTDIEMSFVYKTFLLFGGLLLIMNSFIKSLNTKLTDVYGKIIVCSRVFNAIILWSMCALPFARLGAIVLLCTMVGSVVFQAMIDLLD